MVEPRSLAEDNFEKIPRQLLKLVKLGKNLGTDHVLKTEETNQQLRTYFKQKRNQELWELLCNFCEELLC